MNERTDNLFMFMDAIVFMLMKIMEGNHEKKKHGIRVHSD